MNPPCCVCEAPASKVCQHLECSSTPFYCAGPCTRNASQKMHTHNTVEDFISFQEFQKKVALTKLSLDPYAFHRKFLEDMKKKIILAKDHFQEQYHTLDKTYKELERHLCVIFRMSLTEEKQEVLEKIESDFNGESLTGKDLGKLFSEQKPAKEKITLESIERLKNGFVNGLEKILHINVESMLINAQNIFMSKEESIKIATMLFYQGMELKKAEKFREALSKFQDCRQVNDSAYQIHFQIAACLDNLNELDEALKSYKKCLEMNPTYLEALNNVGVIYKDKKNFQQALKWYNQVLENDPVAITTRGNIAFCYALMKKYQQAEDEINKAIELNPDNQYLHYRKKQILAMIKNGK